MKTSLWIEEGITQVVLTPESDFERGALDTIFKNQTNVHFRRGQFYDCQGGYARQYPGGDRDLIIRLEPTTQTSP
jgi:hypothetical protein